VMAEGSRNWRDHPGRCQRELQTTRATLDEKNTWSSTSWASLICDARFTGATPRAQSPPVIGSGADGKNGILPGDEITQFLRAGPEAADGLQIARGAR